MKRDWNALMFQNVGIKIHKVAKIFAWIGIALSFVGGIAVFFLAFLNFKAMWWMIFVAPVVAAAGCLASWLSALPATGFGKLIDDVGAIREGNEALYEEEGPEGFSCPKCGGVVYYGDDTCSHCGQQFDWTKA